MQQHLPPQPPLHQQRALQASSWSLLSRELVCVPSSLRPVPASAPPTSGLGVGRLKGPLGTQTSSHAHSPSRIGWSYWGRPESYRESRGGLGMLGAFPGGAVEEVAEGYRVAVL